MSNIYNKDTRQLIWQNIWKLPSFEKMTGETITIDGSAIIPMVTHILNISKNMATLLSNEPVSDELHMVLTLAALYAETGKTDTSFFNSERKCWCYGGYGDASAKKFKEDCEQEFDAKTIECVVFFLKYHNSLKYLLSNPMAVRKMIYISHDTFYADICNIKNLLYFVRCLDTKPSDEEMELLKVWSKDVGCYDQPYAFSNGASKYNFFNDSTETLPTQVAENIKFKATFIIGDVSDLSSLNENVSQESMINTENIEEAAQIILMNCMDNIDFSIPISNLPEKAIKAILCMVYKTNGEIHFVYTNPKLIDKLSPTLSMSYIF